MVCKNSQHLETFPVNNRWTAFIIFLLSDPHLLEGRERSQNRTSNPYRVFPLRGSNNLDLNGRWGQGSDFLVHTISNTWVHGGATRHDSVGIQVLTDVHITLHDGVVGGLMNTTGFHSQERGLEESLRGTEPLIANGDNLTVRKLIGLFQGGGGSSSSHFLLEVKSNIAEFLLDVTNNLTLSSSGEGVTTLSKDLHEVVGELTASQVQTEDGMGKSITFIDGDSVGNTISRIHDNTSGTTSDIEGKDSLDGNIHGGHVEGLKHDLSHLLTVSLGVKRSFSQEDGLFLRGNTELIVKSVMPNLFHVIPVGDDAMLNRVFESKNTSFGLSLITYIGIFLTHTDHNTLMAGTANNGWEDSSGSIISCKSSFAHARTIVNDKSSNIFVTHGGVLLNLCL